MSGFSVQVDDSQVTAALRALAARGQDLRQPMTAIGQILVTLSDLSFRGQHDPWGHAWQPLAASTLRGRRKGPGAGSAKILRDSGHLAGSIHYRANAGSVTVGTNVVYAAIQQFGGQIQRQARTQTLYFKRRRDGSVGNRFVARGRSDFAQDVAVGAHTIRIPARPFLPIDTSGRAKLPADTVDQILAVLRRHLDPGAAA